MFLVISIPARRITEFAFAQHNPGALNQFHDIPGSLGRFAGVWSVLIGAAYAFLGTEILGMTAAETHNPTKNIPRAIRGVWVRILLFYIIGVFILGLIVPFNDPSLTTDTGNAASSAWVIAIQRSGIKVLPHIANACFLSTLPYPLAPCMHDP
jgi:amino acid transporter